MAISWNYFKRYIPGVLICAVIALAATFLPEHYGGPQPLYALMIGLSLHFLSQQESNGINFCAKTVLKLFRVVLLMPVVLLIAFAYRKHASVGTTADVVKGELPLVPGFLMGFIVLVLIASTDMVPAAVVSGANNVARWCLVIAISAAGVKNQLRRPEKTRLATRRDAGDGDSGHCRLRAGCDPVAKTGSPLTH